MFPLKSIAIASVFAFALPLAASSQEPANAGAIQKQKTEKIVREYLINNPEIVIKAINEYQRRKQAEADTKKQQAMSSMSDNLKHNPNDPVIGNPKGDVTIVEFFDYRCGYCKRVFPDVQSLIKKDGNIRYVLKEFPILGAESVYASNVAMAVWLHQPDKYFAFHSAMMLNKGGLGETKVMELAQSAGIDTTALKEQMKDPVIEKTLAATQEQAKALNISGTPGFIFGNTLVPGAIDLGQMVDLVVATRKKK